jgi:hypothetical protein
MESGPVRNSQATDEVTADDETALDVSSAAVVVGVGSSEADCVTLELDDEGGGVVEEGVADEVGPAEEGEGVLLLPPVSVSVPFWRAMSFAWWRL